MMIELLLVCKMLRVLVVLLAGLCVAFAAQAIGPLAPKPAKFSNVPGCYIESLDEVIPFGQAVPSPNSCMEYRCGESNIIYISCGVVHAAPPFEVVEDKTKLYPDCCPTVRKSPKMA